MLEVLLLGFAHASIITAVVRGSAVGTILSFKFSRSAETLGYFRMSQFIHYVGEKPLWFMLV